MVPKEEAIPVFKVAFDHVNVMSPVVVRISLDEPA
jgi:hypothetical protein